MTRLFILAAARHAARAGMLAALAVGIVGCNENIPLSQNDLDVARQGYDGLFLAPAATYRELPKCAAGQVYTVLLPCHDPALVARLKAADNLVYTDFETVQADLRTGSGNAITAFQALKVAITTAEALISQTKPQG